MRKYLWLGLYLGPRVLLNWFWITRMAKNPKKYSWIRRYNRVRKFLKMLNRSLRIDYYISGIENLPPIDTYLFYPNHQSFMDPLILIDILRDPLTFVAKEESAKFPFVGKIIKILDGEFMDRNNLREELKTMKNVKHSLLHENKRWAVFPEGTRTKNEDMSMNEFKAGSFKLATATEKMIVPVCMYGTFRPLSTKHHLKRYPVHVHFFEPIKKEEYMEKSTQEIAQFVQDKIKTKLDEFRLKDLEIIKKL